MYLINKFDNLVENKFRNLYIEKSLYIIRKGYLLSIFLYSIFGVLDIWIVPETKHIAWFIRFVIVVPFLIFMLSISYSDFFKRNSQLLLSFSSVILGLGIVFIISFSNPTELGYINYYCGLILVLFWNYSISRLLFWNSFISGLIIIIGYELAAILLQHLNFGSLESVSMLVFINNNFFFLSANIIGLFGSYHKEKYHRSEFLKNKTIQLQNTELLKLNTAKDRFLTIIAHDLKNPFHAILELSKLLLEDLHNEDMKTIVENVNLIHETTQKTNDLLDDMLTLSKAQSTIFTIELQEIAFDKICKEIICDMKFLADKKEITINYFELNNIILYADLNMLKIILRNLILNAIKFSKKNGHINIYRENTNNKAIVISDNGIGIEKVRLLQLWDYSKPISSPGTMGEKGSGLGLLICKELVEKHNGRIWVESEVGKGSKFKFTI